MREGHKYLLSFKIYSRLVTQRGMVSFWWEFKKFIPPIFLAKQGSKNSQILERYAVSSERLWITLHQIDLQVLSIIYMLTDRWRYSTVRTWCMMILFILISLTSQSTLHIPDVSIATYCITHVSLSDEHKGVFLLQMSECMRFGLCEQMECIST